MALLIIALPTAHAQIYTFTGPGNWSSSSNWAPSKPSSPIGAGESVIIIGACIFNVNNFKLDAGSSLTVNVGATLTIGAGNKLNNNTGTITNLGTISNSGTLRNRSSLINNGTLTNNPVGSIEGDGTIYGNFNNDGILDLDAGNVWTFTVTGNYTASATAVHKIEIRNNVNGTNPRSDVIAVGGHAILNGSLELTIDNPNYIISGNAFYPIIANSLSGTFPTISIPGNPSDWTVNYYTTTVELIYSGAPLPIELTAFNGKKVGNAIELNWRTATEYNNAFMEVQRSKDGKTFENLKQVPSKAGSSGNSVTPLEYRIMDENPLTGINYYRLRQVDLDGKEEYHAVIGVLFKEKGNDTAITVFPSIVSDQLNVAFDEEANADGELYISDLSGRLLIRQSLEHGVQQQTVDTGLLPKGPYIVTAYIGRNIQSAKFIKQ